MVSSTVSRSPSRLTTPSIIIMVSIQLNVPVVVAFFDAGQLIHRPDTYLRDGMLSCPPHEGPLPNCILYSASLIKEPLPGPRGKRSLRPRSYTNFP
jgi:hypothetical protein